MLTPLDSPGHVRSAALTLAAAVALAAIAGCNADAAADESPPGQDNLPGAETEDDGRVAQNAVEYPMDRYPSLLAFALLEPDERVRFVGLAEAELCPCEGQVSSLDTCLQDTENVCMLAVEVGSLISRMIKEDADDAEISDGVQLRIAAARAVHEFTLENTPWVGAENPSIVIVEFSDFEYPHCRAMHPVLAQIAADYGDTVRVYYKQFPLGSHANAGPAAVAALAAHQQGMYSAFADMIFEHQNELHSTTDPVALFSQWAGELGMNVERFVTDLQSEALAQQVLADRQEGLDAQVDSTPTLFLDGVQYLDEYSEEALRATLDRRLAN